MLHLVPAAMESSAAGIEVLRGGTQTRHIPWSQVERIVAFPLKTALCLSQSWSPEVLYLADPKDIAMLMEWQGHVNK
jgi:hypothetical protein